MYMAYGISLKITVPLLPDLWCNTWWWVCEGLKWCIYPAKLSVAMLTGYILRWQLPVSHYMSLLHIYNQPYTQLTGYCVELLN